MIQLNNAWNNIILSIGYVYQGDYKSASALSDQAVIQINDATAAGGAIITMASAAALSELAASSLAGPVGFVGMMIYQCASWISAHNKSAAANIAQNDSYMHDLSGKIVDFARQLKILGLPKNLSVVFGPDKSAVDYNSGSYIAYTGPYLYAKSLDNSLFSQITEKQYYGLGQLEGYLVDAGTGQPVTYTKPLDYTSWIKIYVNSDINLYNKYVTNFIPKITNWGTTTKYRLINTNIYLTPDDNHGVGSSIYDPTPGNNSGLNPTPGVIGGDNMLIPIGGQIVPGSITASGKTTTASGKTTYSNTNVITLKTLEVPADLKTPILVPRIKQPNAPADAPVVTAKTMVDSHIDTPQPNQEVTAVVQKTGLETAIFAIAGLVGLAVLLFI